MPFPDKVVCLRAYLSPLVSDIPLELEGSCRKQFFINSLATFQAFPTEHTEAQCPQRYCGNIPVISRASTHRAVTSFRCWGGKPGRVKTKIHDVNGRGCSKTGCRLASGLHNVKQRLSEEYPTSNPPRLSFFKRGGGKNHQSEHKGLQRTK